MADDSNDGGRSITLGKIASYVIGGLLVIGGIASLIRGPGAILIIAGGLFALPPVRRRITERANLTISRWVVLLAVVVLVGVGAASLPTADVPDEDTSGNGFGENSPAAQGTPSQTATFSPTATETQLVHSMGESFVVGSGEQSVRYSVQEAYWAETIGSDTSRTEADGIFLVLIIEMENVGDESFDITDRHLKLVDEQDREFAANFEAGYYTEYDSRIETEGITYEQLQPGLSIERAVVFDVVPDQEYRFKIEPVGSFSAADEHFVELEVEDL